MLETERDPRIERGEIPLDNPLAQRLLGLTVGDELDIEGVGLEPTTYVISEIQNKYVFAHFRSLRDFEELFPENRAFGSFKIDDSKGDDRFKPNLR